MKNPDALPIELSSDKVEKRGLEPLTYGLQMHLF